ncbi:hypothetical protein BZK31_02855 [Pseudomonas floridensis]|uniref:Uncharacterized protein n=1 Tax=Pseudomonas floridensis TaxID=1958950 RepID=A0A1X0NBH8_9PSED|nr:hypothetical protein BZK31_02855 [Pseudomonas floridensis]OSN39188.1 hypothetical protein BV343_00238 [Pseudomonas syringae pv. actinidiae]RMV49272.1 hypothetical protein ALP11_101710 [Pseudomonas syringae pv. papulans]OSN46447.1 hypothetical protein BV344_00238 [Pseudomonas syringae pv. actinidiae]OSR46500.1 hypothetical protein BV321_00238 [Pseudomonas syringae pv. actinidiae]
MKTFLLYLVLIFGGTAAVVAGAVALGYDSFSAMTGWDNTGTPELVFLAICAVFAVVCIVQVRKLNKLYGRR